MVQMCERSGEQAREKPGCLPIPRRYDTGGAPAIHWDALFELWAKSGLPKTTFLARYGLSKKSGTVRKRTRAWTDDARQSFLETARSGTVTVVPQTQADSLYQIVMQWRAGQAERDYRTSERIRRLIERRLVELETPDDNGKLEKIDALELRRLASAHSEVQKQQRLALGMTTENFGAPPLPEPDSNVDNTGNDGTKPDCPVFIVEVTEGGKFRRARPKQIA